ncbi:MAG TPA: TauD/TfdA family dioxygenase [Pyrinomonadaceae bacterium]|jgi:alpha-ketoglutarate-dependent taurine dioxygenase
MERIGNEGPPFNKGLRGGARRAVRVSPQALVSEGYLEPGRSLPLVLRPAVEGLDLAAWAGANRDEVERRLLEHGAILFRGFDVKSPAQFERFMQAASGGALEYGERSSPRSRVGGNIYTSTDYPPDRAIFLHNEQSYNSTFPLRIVFHCRTPAAGGGETPIADTRKIFARLPREIVERFREKRYTYVRNFGDGFGLSWQTAFQTNERGEVEDYCRRNDIRFQWKDGGRLRTSQVRRAAARHPRTNEAVWFNHLTFFHVSTLDRDVREALLAQFAEEDLPNNTLYGDGTPVEPAVMDELRAAYLREKVSFRWERGDVLMLDNMLASHGREPYEGERSVLVGMAESLSWESVGEV